jgi:hypothetical protein
MRGFASGYFSLVHWDLRESMREADVEVILERVPFGLFVRTGADTSN